MPQPNQQTSTTMLDVVISGIGIVSCLGEGKAPHIEALTQPADAPTSRMPEIETQRFAPYSVHPLPDIDWSQQITKRSDLRQMENWQRIGVYCAGLALDDAQMKGNEALCSTMDMIVAAGGGERDEQVDSLIIDSAIDCDDREQLLNEKLTTELRPTLFLAQLSNLLAGNISIVHKVTGSSRTFMGEESAGISAIETAAARIRAGQSTHALVGGAFNGEHPDTLLAVELGGKLHQGPWKSIWQRQQSEGGGVILGSGGAFLVLEERNQALARGAHIYATLGPVVSGRSTPKNRAQNIAAIAKNSSDVDYIISANSGEDHAIDSEYQALGSQNLRGFSSLTGSMKEAQFPVALALGALAIDAGEPISQFSNDENASSKPAKNVMCSCVSFTQGEGIAFLSKEVQTS